MSDRFLNIVLDDGYDGIFAFLVVFSTNFSGDGEAGRYGNTDEVHLSEVGTFSSKKIFHIGTAFCFAIAERINSFHQKNVI